MCFGHVKRKILKNAAYPTKNHGFTKQKHIRGDKTLKKYRMLALMSILMFKVTFGHRSQRVGFNGK